MRISFLLMILIHIGCLYAQPCSISDAKNCQCLDSTTNCDLLPDITISGYGILNHLNGPREYSQVGNGNNNGRLRLSTSTPNIGFGPLTVGAYDIWVCGTDTFTSFPTICLDGSSPKQLIKQKIYYKNQDTMGFYERWAGSMTYHPTHGHMHVDDWAVFSLRLENPNEPDTLKWPIVGEGSKLGFCLMDYGTCGYYNGHCRDSSNNILTAPDFPNYGLGGGQYSCSPIEQGISVGYTDIYGRNLDGMWINIPPGTCNGDYWITVEVDPNNNFVEFNEKNNWTAVPFTLIRQSSIGSGSVAIASSVALGDSNKIETCISEPVILTASAATSYLWSNGDTVQKITVSQPGKYYVQTLSPCGIGFSDTLLIETIGPLKPTVITDTVCKSQKATLQAIGNGMLFWYDKIAGGNLLGTGNTYETPPLDSTQKFYVEDRDSVKGLLYSGGIKNPTDFPGFYHDGDQHLEFYAYRDFILESVKVLANGSKNRTLELRDTMGTVIMDTTVYIADGINTIKLEFPVDGSKSYELGTKINSQPDLYRNHQEVQYPYPISDLAVIVNSSAGEDFYYFFYNWKIREQNRMCISNRSSVLAKVETCTSTDPLNRPGFDFIIIPNPTNGNLKIVVIGLDNDDANLNIVNIQGEKVFSEFDLKGSTKLNLNHLPQGIYHVILEKNGYILSKSIIIQ